MRTREFSGVSRGPLAAGAAAFAAAVVVDLATKALAVALATDPRAVVYNDRPDDLPVRLAVCALTVGVLLAFDVIGGRRGLGRLWGAWIGAGVLIGGTLSNGVSSRIWERGVPDFIRPSDGWVWNLADFMIGVGLFATASSIAVSAALAYAQGLLPRSVSADD